MSEDIDKQTSDLDSGGRTAQIETIFDSIWAKIKILLIFFKSRILG